MDGIDRLARLLANGTGRRGFFGVVAAATVLPGTAGAQGGEGPHFPCRTNEYGDLELPMVVARCNRRQKRRWSASRWAVECTRLGQADCDGACVRPRDQHRCAPPGSGR